VTSLTWLVSIPVREAEGAGQVQGPGCQGRAQLAGGDGGSGRGAGQRGGGPVRVSRQSVYSWRQAKYAEGGIDGLRDASNRPRTSPSR
jgi:leucine-zipper of insertion element IS481